MPEFIYPDWPVNEGVRALFTTRQGGNSQSPYDSLNLGDHVDDAPGSVMENRELLAGMLPSAPCWLNQVHSTRCIDAVDADRNADAAVTDEPGRVLAVMVADCLPILLANTSGTRVGVIHAGWRGLADGVISATFNYLGQDGSDWIAWLGPAIGPCHYEVGDDVRDRFPEDLGFSRSGSKWLMNMDEIARSQLMAAGVQSITGGGTCTFCDAERFYSYRRDGVTGRMAGLVWLKGLAE